MENLLNERKGKKKKTNSSSSVLNVLLPINAHRVTVPIGPSLVSVLP